MRWVRQAKHHLSVYDGTTDAIIAVIVSLAAVEAVALIVVLGIPFAAGFVGWIAFGAILIGLPWFWERLFGEDEEPSPNAPQWSGIPRT